MRFRWRHERVEIVIKRRALRTKRLRRRGVDEDVEAGEERRQVNSC